MFLLLTMDPFLRDPRWPDSSSSSSSFDGGSSDASDATLGVEPDFIITRQGPELKFTTEFMARHKEFWHICLVGMLIDEAPISSTCMATIIQNAWHLQELVYVVGLLHGCYIFKFNNAADRYETHEG